MALLSLKDIGKIYVSEGSVAVGIRGVNLSFDRGEFVAITGKSGSGKSTLLNVISGMDTYEEGELYIEGQPTSHYLQPEWEEYRERYISFIFQDYNIIESFTVLQNVELALMHIEDKKARRTRALELIKRVGLSSHAKHKGSKLSGGQKQRTVIARALAKDSPIILADEPTGNLDSVTSKEIIELLKEVSRDKLLIVVTHNFDQVAEHATRHVRVFDGAIESDHVIRQVEKPVPAGEEIKAEEGKRSNRQIVKNGITLGRTIFTAKPRLSAFLCFLMLIGTMGIFLVTSVCGAADDGFKPNYMFTHIEGRMVIAKQSGQTISEDEISALATQYGAKNYLRFDKLLDEGSRNQITIPTENGNYGYLSANTVYGKDYGKNIIGRYPKEKNEVFLYLPITFQTKIGKRSIGVEEILIGNTVYKLVGVKYYYDNNRTPECLFTEDGFRTATAVYFMKDYSEFRLFVVYNDKMGEQVIKLKDIVPCFDMPADKIYVSSREFNEMIVNPSVDRNSIKVAFFADYHNYNYNYGDSSKMYTFEKSFTMTEITLSRPNAADQMYLDGILISDELLCDIAEGVLDKSYRQATLFFENDKAAHRAVEGLKSAGYVAVPSDTTYDPDAFTVIGSILASSMLIFTWVLSIVFLAFFINLCSSRTIGAFKGDMAIMRSMGIPVRVVQIGMYVRMLISLVPALVIVAITAILIFTSPILNEYFVYLYAWQYVLIAIGMLALTVRTTYKQIRKLFGVSVKKSLKGGNAE